MGLVLLIVLTVVLVPQLRQSVREVLVQPEREVLAAVTADLARTGEALRVIKVIEGHKLFIEIYTADVEGGTERLDRQVLAGSKNAYFTFRGESTSLALSDLDADGSLEIITPSFESGLIARMNVFKFMPQTRRLLELKHVPLPGERAHQD